jgi:hypothetical protein
VSSLKESDLHVMACEVTKPNGSQELVYAGWLAMGAGKKLAKLPRRELVYLSDAEAEIDRLRAKLDTAYGVVADLGGEVREPEFEEAKRWRDELVSLRAEVAELAQQRGDLAARVVELRSLIADGDVFALIGHAELLRGLGQQDMPNYFYELAARLAKVVGDGELVRRSEEMRDSRTVSVASDSQPNEKTR